MGIEILSNEVMISESIVSVIQGDNEQVPHAQVVDEFPGEPSYVNLLALCYSDLASALLARGQVDQAAELIQQGQKASKSEITIPERPIPTGYGWSFRNRNWSTAFLFWTIFSSTMKKLFHHGL